MTRVLRLSKSTCTPRQEGWQDIHRVIGKLAGEKPSWWNLPGPQGDEHIVTGVTINIAQHELCGVVDERQLRLWWPEWSINALGAHESEHDVYLDVYEVEYDHFRVGTYQTVFDPQLATRVASIPLASSGLTFNDVVAYLGDQNARAVARGDRYATLSLNA